MSVKKYPNEDPRWSTKEAIDETPSDADAPIFARLWRKIKFLKYNMWVRQHMFYIESLGILAAIFITALLLIWQIGGFEHASPATKPSSQQPSSSSQPSSPPQSQTPEASAPQSTTPAPSSSAHSSATGAGKAAEPAKVSESGVAKSQAVHSGSPDHSGSVESQAKEKKPPLPDDVTRWQRADYLQAREDKDPRLLRAVTSLRELAEGEEPTPETLVALLELPKNANGESTSAAPSLYQSIPAERTKLVQVIVQALGESRSEFARNAIRQILTGELTTDNARAAGEAALKVLAEHPCPENDALFLQALVSPKTLRSLECQQTWSAKEMQVKAAELLKTGDTEAIRVKLAENIAQGFIHFRRDDPLHKVLDAMDPVNCRAQILLYQQPNIDHDTRVRMEEQFLCYASLGMAKLLGVPEDLDPPKTTKPSVLVNPQASNIPMRMAEQLWSDAFGNTLEDRVAQIRSYAVQPHLAILACSIPTDPARASALKMLRKYWNNGPAALEAAGLPNRVVTDPGMLVLLKMLPRRDSKQAKTLSKPRPGNVKPDADRQQIAQDWMTISSKIVTSWCNRFREAAVRREKVLLENSKADADKPSNTPLPDYLELGADASIRTTYHLSWPQDVPPASKSLNLGSLEVYYFGIEEITKPKKAIGFYARQSQIRPADVKTLDKSVWIDSLRTDSSGGRRSMDILISRAKANTANAADLFNDETDVCLSIEILIIEIKNPGSSNVESKDATRDSEGKETEPQDPIDTTH
jgi:hypothetical protein